MELSTGVAISSGFAVRQNLLNISTVYTVAITAVDISKDIKETGSVFHSLASNSS